MENCSERGDKEDKKTSEEFFKLIEKIVQRSEAKKSENGACSRPGDRPGRPWQRNGRPARSNDWHELLSVGSGRPTSRPWTGVGRPAGRSTDAFCLS